MASPCPQLSSEKTDYSPEFNHWTLKGGKAQVIHSGATLEWTADGKTLRLRAWNEAGTIWWFEDLRPGQYLLSAEYEYAKSGGPNGSAWVGKVRTQSVRFEIVPTLTGLKQSKPVRAQGVDFQAVVEPTWVAPRRGSREIALGLSITNHMKKPLVFNFTDTPLTPVLRNAAGQIMEYSYERVRRKVRSLPILVGPGKTQTRLYCTSSSRIKDILCAYGATNPAANGHLKGWCRASTL